MEKNEKKRRIQKIKKKVNEVVFVKPDEEINNNTIYYGFTFPICGFFLESFAEIAVKNITKYEYWI